MHLYSSIASFWQDYDAFLVDLWGVVHDGLQTYPAVKQTLEKLRQQKKHVIFVSNAPRRKDKAIFTLEKLGIHSLLYDQVVTSGEVTYQTLKEHPDRFGQYYFIIGPERDDGLLDGLDVYQRVSDLSRADYVLLTGFDHDDDLLANKLPLLQQSLDYNLPFICANPDEVVVRRSGKQALCAGLMAKKYESMGGKSYYFGKPYAPIYSLALSLLPAIPRNRIAAIGDSLTTDIKGANEQKIDSYLIPGGILAKELAIQHGEMPDLDRLQQLCERYGITPTGVLAAFQ